MCVLENNVLEGVSRTDAYPGTNPFRSCQIARQYLTLMRAAAHCISGARAKLESSGGLCVIGAGDVSSTEAPVVVCRVSVVLEDG